MNKWVLIASPFALIGAKAMFDHNHAQNFARFDAMGTCLDEATSDGIHRARAKRACTCTANGVERWGRRNPGKTYNRVVHSEIVNQCFSFLDSNRDLSDQHIVDDIFEESRSGSNWGAGQDAGEAESNWGN